MTDKLIDDIRKELDNDTISSNLLFEESLSKAKKYQDKYNSFVTIIDKKEEEKSDSILSGIPYALKDNISTKGILTTGSSNILKDYIPLYDATVYKKLKESGAVLMGKTVLDELAMGGTGTTGHTGIVRNPWDSKRMIGGSSAGSAAAVALGIVPFSIGSDTGDSIRKPAAYGGVLGYKPTYGRISRYGLFAFASSLDHVGVFARSVKDVSYVMDVIKGHDEKDMTSLPDEDISYVNLLNNDVKGKKLFYIKEALEINNISEELKSIFDNFRQTVDKCRELGIEVEEVGFGKELLEAIYPVYNVISCAEATSNNSNLTGIPFGTRIDGKNIDDIMMKTRTEGFSELIKRRFVIGSYVLQKENQEKLFLNACRVRRLVVDRMNELFKKYDGLIMPSAERIAPLFGESSDRLSDEYLILGNHLCIANFGGFPSISIPSGFVSNMPVSVNITGRAKEDGLVLNMANKLEEVLGYKGQVSISE
ncbi:MAG: aspartyl/glutamyl-tRNA amidotransferase subunit A [Bacilli bacterium]|nr:aspartyl/glutamyl-tRNA amidotransferase subunit A [Bacilli bacterium]